MLYILYLPVYWLFAHTLKYFIGFFKVIAPKETSRCRKRTGMHTHKNMVFLCIYILSFFFGIISPKHKDNRLFPLGELFYYLCGKNFPTFSGISFTVSLKGTNPFSTLCSVDFVICIRVPPDGFVCYNIFVWKEQYELACNFSHPFPLTSILFEGSPRAADRRRTIIAFVAASSPPWQMTAAPVTLPSPSRQSFTVTSSMSFPCSRKALSGECSKSQSLFATSSFRKM